MKIKERAVQVLEEGLEQLDPNLCAVDRRRKLVLLMRQAGFTTVTTMNLPETARSLGFVVIGNEIFGRDA